jgi:hypothetical protein
MAFSPTEKNIDPAYWLSGSGHNGIASIPAQKAGFCIN